MPNTVARGSRGVVVRELQGHLCEQGARVKVDGIYGSQTEAAVRTFQHGAHLPQDGIAGALTWNALHGVRSTPRRSVQRAPEPDWSFERMLRSGGDLVAGLNPFGAAAPTARPVSRGGAEPSQPAARTQPSSAPAARIEDGLRAAKRIRFDGYEGRGWIIANPQPVSGQQIREIGAGKFAVNPTGKFPRFTKNECVALVKYYGVPATSAWCRGPRVCAFKPGELPIGTVIATLRDGSYHSDYSGRSHVGIYLGHDDHDAYVGNGSKTAGVRMRNQWNGAIVQDSNRPYGVNADAFGKKSKKAWLNNGKMESRRVSWIADGEEYYVVLTK